MERTGKRFRLKQISQFICIYFLCCLFMFCDKPLRIFYFPFFDSCFPFPILFNMKILILYFYLSVTSYTFKLSLPSVPTAVYLQLFSVWTLSVERSSTPVKHCTYNAILRDVRLNMFAVERQYVLCILSVCLYPYLSGIQCVCAVCISFYSLAVCCTLPHKRKDYRRKFLEPKTCVLIFYTNSSKKFFDSKNNLARYHKRTEVFV